MRRFTCIALLVLVAVFPGRAQTSARSSISGVVADDTGEALAKAEVQLINFSHSQVAATRTDRAGGFVFEDLDSGRYSLAFLADGYAVQRLGPIELLPGSPREVAVRLERLGPPLTRPRAGIETIALEYGMVREQIAATPILLGSQGRTAVDKLMLLVPGLTAAQPVEVDPASGLGAPVSANGTRRSQINYRLDGAFNNAQNRLTGAQAATFAPAPEALEAFQVITHTYSAAEGRNAGAVVRLTTRGGGEQWHGQVRGLFRPHQNAVEFFDKASDSLSGWTAGAQAGGPLWKKKKLYSFVDVERWRTNLRHSHVSPVLSLAERAGDFSGQSPQPADPSFPDGMIPASRLDPFVQSYLDAFVPLPNDGDRRHRSLERFDSSGEMLTGRLDWRRERWAISGSHSVFRNDVRVPLAEVLTSIPDAAEDRRQLSNNFQTSIAYTASARFQQTTRLAGQRLSVGLWRGAPGFRNLTSNEFGFDFASFGVNPGTIPDVTLYDNAGFERLRITPFLSSEGSAQTAWQASHDLQWRAAPAVLIRAGGHYGQGFWPFINTENFAGSFSFPAPPEPPIRSRPNGLRDLLLGVPGEYRLQTPRDLNLRWRESAVYGETELRPTRTLQLTLGLRFEEQPPAVDTQDRLAAYRRGAQSQRFPEALPNLIFPGDLDPLGGVLPRSTVETSGRNFAPRAGLAFSPGSDRKLARWIFGEPGRSVFRASYGQFYDFGAFGGSSAAALFGANYPPFSVDNRFPLTGSAAQGAFRRPFGALPTADPAKFFSPEVVRYPVLVFDRAFENARAHHWNLGFQRLLPAGVFVSAAYVGSRSLRLQRQREINEFVRNPLRPFTFVRLMRLSSRFSDVRQFESTGSGRYNSLQLRASRYLRRGLAFDANYTWSRSDDNGSSVFGEELATARWTVSNFDRRHNLNAAWVYGPRFPRAWLDRSPWLDRWLVSGIWRWRSGLPLDIRQSEDPTFTFVQTGRPDVLAPFRAADPGSIQEFALADGRTIRGRFGFDPTIFRRVSPNDFSETRSGNIGRNAFRMRGFQQWDLRISRPIDIAEGVSAEFGLDLINAFGHRNWDAPFSNIDHPFFGVVRAEGVRRTLQAAIRIDF